MRKLVIKSIRQNILNSVINHQARSDRKKKCLVIIIITKILNSSLKWISSSINLNNRSNKLKINIQHIVQITDTWLKKQFFKDFSRKFLWNKLCEKKSFQKTEDFEKKLAKTKTRKMTLHCLVKTFYLWQK